MKTILLILLLNLSTAESFARGSRFGAPDRKLTRSSKDYILKGFRNAPWIKDPFYPVSVSFTISGIISREKAYINGAWYQVGEEVEGYTVQEIRPDGATLIKKAKLIILKMHEELEKETAR